MHPNQVTFSRAAAYRLRVRPIEGALVRARAPFYSLKRLRMWTSQKAKVRPKK